MPFFYSGKVTTVVLKSKYSTFKILTKPSIFTCKYKVKFSSLTSISTPTIFKSGNSTSIYSGFNSYFPFLTIKYSSFSPELAISL